jgi:antitoxin YefM
MINRIMQALDVRLFVRYDSFNKCQMRAIVNTVITATQARANLYRLIDDTAVSHAPVTITGKQNNAVLVSESDWLAIQETLYLSSIPGMRESIKEGMQTPVDQCSKDLDW